MPAATTARRSRAGGMTANPIDATFDRAAKAWRRQLSGGCEAGARDLPARDAWEVWATDGAIAVRSYIDHGFTLREAIAQASDMDRALHGSTPVPAPSRIVA